MRYRYLLSLIVVTAGFILWSCTENVTGPNEKGELSRELTQSEKKLVETSESFSFNLFKQTVEQADDENVFISPLSISIALGMTMNGAEGETFEQMRQTLAFSGLTQQEINEGYESLITLLKEVDPKVSMEVANSVWSNKGFAVQEEFKQTLAEYFNAEATELDFRDPEAKDVINTWVKENTNGLIEKIIEDEIPPEMVMYLINAIYFKGDWTYQFDPERTRESYFALENDEQVTVEMMNQENKFNVLMNDDVHMIDLPYGDSLFTMTVLMPGDRDMTIDDFIQNKFSRQQVAIWYDELEYRKIPLGLPKFTLEFEIEMKDILYSMGMEDAFTRKADLSGINPDAPLFISEVKHKTFVEVNEEGTEAAAVTSVGIGVTSVPQSFNVNRPFIFMIREQNSGAILFMGKVMNPNA
ncbi:MAG: proteinase inhibitor I4 serpin [Balneola sp.]|nr:proteinase inhibitor I4 serpin [Balneola sp.]